MSARRFAGFSLPNAIPIPEELWTLLPEMGEAELKVVLFLLYKTLGFRKREDAISLSQIIAGTGLSRPAVARAIHRLQEKGVVEVFRSTSPEGDRETNVYRPRFRDGDGLQGGSKQSELPPQGECKQSLQGGSQQSELRSQQSELTCITAAATAADGFCRFFLTLTDQQREPQADEIDEIRRLLQEGIPEQTIRDGIRQAVVSRRSTDPPLTVARCAGIVRRLHRRRTRQGTSPAPSTGRGETVIPAATDGTVGAETPRPDRSPSDDACFPAADRLAVDRAAALPASPAGPEDETAAIWAALQEAGMDDPILRRALRRLMEEYSPEAVYDALLETLAHRIQPGGVIGYIRAILERKARDAAGEAEEVGEGRDGPEDHPLPLPTATPRSPEERLWEQALEELRLQLTTATFANLLAGSRLAVRDGNTFVVRVTSDYARAWLEHRLRPVVEQALSRLIGGPAEVRFVAEGDDAPVSAR